MIKIQRKGFFTFVCNFYQVKLIYRVKNSKTSDFCVKMAFSRYPLKLLSLCRFKRTHKRHNSPPIRNQVLFGDSFSLMNFHVNILSKARDAEKRRAFHFFQKIIIDILIVSPTQTGAAVVFNKISLPNSCFSCLRSCSDAF